MSGRRKRVREPRSSQGDEPHSSSVTGLPSSPTDPTEGAEGPSPSPGRSSPLSNPFDAPDDESEADEDNAIEDDDAGDQEESEGEDLMETNEQDYRRIRELDHYEGENLDDAEQGDDDPDARAAAEEAMERRDRIRGAVGRRGDDRMPAALQMDREYLPTLAARRQAQQLGEASEQEVSIALEDYKGPIREYIVLGAPRNEIKKRFKQFLTTFLDRNHRPVYSQKIQDMCSRQLESLEVSFVDLSRGVSLLAIWVADAPNEMLEIFDEVTMEVVRSMFPEYHHIHDAVHVRIAALPIADNLRDLRQIHLNVLIKVTGVVTRRTSVFPQLKLVRFDCAKCGYALSPLVQNTEKEVRPGSCPECQSKGPFMLNEQTTVYRNYQKITLQESPGKVPAGRLPRSKEVILLGDLIDTARPGEEIDVTGVYKNSFDSSLNNKQGFPVFSTIIEANFIAKKEDAVASSNLTTEERKEILKLAREPNIGDRIIDSIAPSIYGHRNIKTALAFALFGGEAKEAAGQHRLRGDVNVLLIGDPGTAKSQCLKFVEQTASRAVFTTGQGASAVGLTASVRRDPVTREFTLEGGALVLADRGVCLIDEFDKMNDQDRTSIHEAMEQQSISISKAGIVTTLQARCSVVAAANPIRGKYDAAMSLSENVDLSEPLLSRFDVICILRDTADPVADELLARFVVQSHIRSHPRNAGDAPRQARLAANQLPQDVLRKYITYARSQVRPRLTQVDQDKLSTLYADLRRQIHAISGGVQVSVRHIESVIRMSEAHARMHLRDFVRDDDVDMAIRVLLESFIDQQKFAVKRTLEKNFARYITYKKDNIEMLMYILNALHREQLLFLQSRSNLQSQQARPPAEVRVDLEELESRARAVGVHDLRALYESEQFKEAGFELDNAGRTVVRRHRQ
eukprot:TRINITY_DN5349_c0_g1_i1.p1 TRINITY_DN5349_c0_g1~~TRINITY_DN5349_c0_g1_i1.p1  ORF type:complete len:910 (-),score=254.80 TRINITY_DN5349_c0_g1_i1:47-2776(-)